VLAVDDEQDALELLNYLLTRHGAEVRAESSVAGALAALKTWRPDVIVSDIAMPGEDGFSLIKQLRALPEAEGGRIPVVALTAYVGKKERAKIFASGFQMYLPKPVEAADLLEALAGFAPAGE
jgi:CheY-like chemotaxis protein